MCRTLVDFKFSRFHSKNKAIHFHLICPVRKGLGKIRKKYLISNELYHRIFKSRCKLNLTCGQNVAQAMRVPIFLCHPDKNKVPLSGPE